jgi:hypothetical protein
MWVGADERVGGRGEELVLWSVWGDGADGGDWVGEMTFWCPHIDLRMRRGFTILSGWNNGYGDFYYLDKLLVSDIHNAYIGYDKILCCTDHDENNGCTYELYDGDGIQKIGESVKALQYMENEQTENQSVLKKCFRQNNRQILATTPHFMVRCPHKKGDHRHGFSRPDPVRGLRLFADKPPSRQADHASGARGKLRLRHQQ